MRLAGDVHHVLRAAEGVDRLRHKALRPGLARALDLRDAVAAGAFRFAHDARIGVGKRAIGEQRAGFRYMTVGKIDRG